MKFPPQKQLIFQGRLKSFGIGEKLQAFPQRPLQFLQQSWQKMKAGRLSPLHLLERIKRIGVSSLQEDYDQRKLGIFNQLNFFQLLTGIIVPIGSIYHHQKLPALAWMVTSLPAFVSV